MNNNNKKYNPTIIKQKSNKVIIKQRIKKKEIICVDESHQP